jgi:hypothetical protein
MWDQIQSSTDQLVYFALGAGATALFVIRMLLMMVGADHATDGDFDTAVHGDADFAAHGHADHGSASHSFQLFSLLTVLAFFMGAGWAGLAARLTWGFGGAASAAAACGFGLACMLLAAWLVRGMRRLESMPRLDLGSCVGTTAQVYLLIPARGKGRGQVRLNVQGASRIVAASSNGGELPAFTSVRVVSVQPDSSVVVEAQP